MAWKVAVSSPAREDLSFEGRPETAAGRETKWGWNQPRWITVGIILAAFALRLYRLGVPSLGFDESFNLLVAGSSLEALPGLLTSQEPYPPLHFALLHVWTALAGQTEFAARFWALLFGVLLIALLNRLATLLLGTAAGVLVAALAAFSPAYLWYSQEIKMYPLLAALVAGSLLLFARLALSQTGTGDRPRNPVAWRWTWAAYVVTTAAALYVHYTAVLVVVFEVLIGWALGIRRGRRTVVWWLTAQAAVVALFLPWVWLARRLLGGYQSDAPAAGLPLATLRTLWQVFGIGYSDELQHRLAGELWVTLWSAGLLGLAVLGLIARGRAEKSGFARWLALATFLVPLGLFLLLAAWRPVFAARHATVISVGYYLVLGGGLARLAGQPWRGLGRGSVGQPWPPGVALAGLSASIGLGALAVLWSVALFDYFSDPAYTRTDNRAVAQFVQAHAGPDETI